MPGTNAPPADAVHPYDHAPIGFAKDEKSPTASALPCARKRTEVVGWSGRANTASPGPLDCDQDETSGDGRTSSQAEPATPAACDTSTAASGPAETSGAAFTSSPGTSNPSVPTDRS